MCKKFLFSFFLFFQIFLLRAQNSYILQDKDFDYVENFEVLADKNYTFEQILHDKSLHFTKYVDKYDCKGIAYCWLRFSIKNHSSYAQYAYFSVLPMLDNTFYSYNTDTKSWQSLQAGMEVDTGNRRNNLLPCVFQANKIDTFFIKLKVSQLAKQPHKVDFNIKIEQAKYYSAQEQFILVLWVATLVTMLAFFFYNLYIYFIFKDITYLYYLMTLVGGIIYITANHTYFNVLLPLRFFNIVVNPNGHINFFDLNVGFARIGIMLVMIGFVQFARIYLQLSWQFLFWDRILKYMLYLFCGIIISDILVTLSGIYYVDNLLVLPLNILLILIILLLFYLGVISLRKGYTSALYFLLANSLSLLFILVLTIYLVLYRSYGQVATLLPNLVIILQTLTFAAALVARVNNLKEELKQKQMEAQVLQRENEQIVARNQFIELENEYILAEMMLEKNQKEELQAKFEANQRELASNTLYLYQKNELLTNLQKQIEKLSQKNLSEQKIELKEELKTMNSTIKNSLHLETDWEKFKLHFEQVHPSFFKELLEKHPTLTNNEIRLCAYFHLNLSTKEIAKLLSINPDSVHKAKTRLNKKLNNVAK
jgi:hypothetical protein